MVKTKSEALGIKVYGKVKYVPIKAVSAGFHPDVGGILLSTRRY
jgi:hypothetical protein